MGILDQAIFIKPKKANMKTFFKRLLGINIPKELTPVIKTPKEIATENKEPWVAVMNTHVNKDNIRNGFFELDWNEYFVLQLRTAGYAGSTDEEIVDAWFSELCRNLGGEAGIDMNGRGAGFVDRALRDDGRTEIG